MKHYKFAQIIFVAALLSLLSACANQQSSVLLTPPVVTDAAQTTAVQSSATESVQSPVTDSPTAQTPSEVKLYLNGNKITLNSPVQLIDNHVMVPISEICSYFSREIICDTQESVLTIQDQKNSAQIIITAGSDQAQVNGESVAMEAAAVLNENGEMLVELSAFRTLLKADTKYNEEFASAYITESGLC